MKGWLAALLALLLGMACQALIVEKISLEANFPLDREQLLQAAGLRTGEEYDPAAVNASIAAMQSLLQARGHPFVRIPLPELIPLSSTGMELSFRLEELVPADGAALRFSGLRYFTEAKLRELLLLADGQRVAISELPALMDRILDQYHRRGYLFASVRLDSLALEEGFSAWLGISEGRPLRPENYYFQGNTYTRDNTLVKLAGLSQAGVITPALLRTAEENILRKSYINACRVEPLDPSSILIQIEEGKMTYLEGVLGFTQLRDKTELTGLINLQFLNLWGSDRSLGLNWRQNPFSSLLQLNYHESGPTSFPLSADLSLSRVVQDSTWIRSSLATDIYSYGTSQKYGLELALEGIAPGTRRPIQVENSARRSIGVFWRLDTRDQLLNPSRGAQTNLTYRVRFSDTDERWTNALEASHTHYLGLSQRWTFALGLHLRSLADSTAADYSLYRLGGYNSLRGFREEEFSSWRLGWTNLELRYLINPGSRIYLFYDHGILALSKNKLRSDLFAPGLGIKVRTRLGILSIEYGLGHRENGFADLGAGMVHAGLDTSF
ncbi:MAG: BamA/TamA family outer membrane protein [Candidatus Syntrophosphaera sp.]|nr:BamA/TamA family outer membrane protein [Candidatus Syntrophosphaera sp.]